MIRRAQNIARKRERLFKISNSFSSVFSQWDTTCIFSLLLLFRGLFEQRNENLGRSEKKKTARQKGRGKEKPKSYKGAWTGKQKRKQVTLKNTEKGIVIGQDIDMLLEYLSCTLGNQCRNCITFRETFAYSLLV